MFFYNQVIWLSHDYNTLLSLLYPGFSVGLSTGWYRDPDSTSWTSVLESSMTFDIINYPNPYHPTCLKDRDLSLISGGSFGRKSHQVIIGVAQGWVNCIVVSTEVSCYCTCKLHIVCTCMWHPSRIDACSLSLTLQGVGPRPLVLVSRINSLKINGWVNRLWLSQEEDSCLHNAKEY